MLPCHIQAPETEEERRKALQEKLKRECEYEITVVTTNMR